MKNLWRESNKNHWGDKVNASGHFKTGFMKKYSDPAEIGALKEASDLRIGICHEFATMSWIFIKKSMKIYDFVANS